MARFMLKLDDVVDTAVVVGCFWKQAIDRWMGFFKRRCRFEKFQNRCGIGRSGVLHPCRGLSKSAAPGTGTADGLALVQESAQGQHGQKKHENRVAARVMLADIWAKGSMGMRP
jgi:hypothetical protein